MNVFSPYIVIEDTQSKLHLKVTSLRRTLHLFVLRFFPFLYLFFAIYFIRFKSDDLPSVVSIIIVGALVVPAILIFRAKFVSEVTITKLSIDIISDQVFKSHEKNYMVAFVDHIVVRRRGGKAAAYIYSLVTKTENKKEQIFLIPRIYISKEKQSVINNKLETLTGLQVVATGRRLF